jgi:hypothetical protein
VTLTQPATGARLCSGAAGQEKGRATEDFSPSEPEKVAVREDRRAPKSRTIHLRFQGANSQPTIAGTGELPGRANYFLGRDPAHWTRGASLFTRVQVKEIYPGIDLIYYGNQQQLEYDFEVAPGADPGAISFHVAGADRLEIDRLGNLILKLGTDELRQPKPVIYQTAGGTRRQVAGGYCLKDHETVAFRLGAYDRTLPLVIDPLLSYSTFLGGPASDVGRAITLDNSGNIYIAGDTLTKALATTDSLQTTNHFGYPGGLGDAFVAKFNAADKSLAYLTYLGGAGDDAATAIAVDSQGNAYLTGVTDSTDFPIAALTIKDRLSGKGEPVFGLHPFDAFVAKLSPDGSQLIYSTYLGGKLRDEGLGIAVDANSCAYVAGFTESPDFPTTNAFRAELRGFANAFVTKIASNGLSFAYSTFLGGTNLDHAESIAVDALGRAYVTGYTMSTNFPVSTNALQPALSSFPAGTNSAPTGASGVINQDVFVTILETDGQSLVQSTYLGGQGDDIGSRIKLDTAGNVYVTGLESGFGFPVTPGHLNPGGFFKSSDAATNWAASNAGLLHIQVHAIGIDPVNPSNLYVGTGRGLARSTDAGATWQPSPDTFGQFYTFAIDPSAPSTIYAGGADVLKSTNYGLSWFSSSTGRVSGLSFKATNLAFTVVNKLVLDTNSPATLYAGTDAGILKSTNGAATWKLIDEGLPKGQAARDLVLDPLDSATLYAATTAGVFRSTNSGAHWYDFGQGLAITDVELGITNVLVNERNLVRALAIDSATTPTIYAGTSDGTIYRRADQTTNWVLTGFGFNSPIAITSSNFVGQNFFTNFSSASVTALATDPLAPATVYAGTTIGVYKSLDAGTNWFVATNGLPNLPITALAIDPLTPSNVYAGTYNSFAGIDAFLTKFGPELSSIMYSIVFGGNGADQAQDLAVDSDQNVFVAGTTTSANFPAVRSGSLTAYNSGGADVFVAAFNSDASDYLYSGYIGGRGNDIGAGIAVNDDDTAYVVGSTTSFNFPAFNARQSEFGGSNDVFLVEIQMTDVPINVTIQTDPPGLAFLVDGVRYTNRSAQPLPNWFYGSRHIVSAPTQTGGTNIQYVWTSWSDEGALSHEVFFTNDASLTATFKTQYFLSMNADSTNGVPGGEVNPPSAYYDAGTNLLINAAPALGSAFLGWTGAGAGSFTGADNPASITMNGPVTETASFSGPLTDRLTVVLNPSQGGSISPDYNGKLLRIGKTYRIIANPGPGYAFASWSAWPLFAQSVDRNLGFTMASNLVLQANFVPSPFTNSAGTYAGLFYDTNRVEFRTSGFITLAVTEKGSFTGKLRLAGITFRLTGQFAPDGTLASITVSSLGFAGPAVSLQLDLTSGKRVTGVVVNGNSTARLLANRAIYSKQNPLSQTKTKYILVIPGGADSLYQPGGDSFGTVTIDKLGTIQFVGTLADGTKISQQTFLSGDGLWPLYASLYSGGGVVLGWVAVTNTTEADLGGRVAWIKLAQSRPKIYTDGFTLEKQALLSPYSFTNGQPVLDFPESLGQVVLENGNLSQSLIDPVSLTADNKVTSSGTNKLTLTLSTSSGLFRGTFFHPDTRKTTSFSGAVLQQQNRGAGFFLGRDESGRVQLAPPF